MSFPTRSWVQNKIWDFSETLLGAEDGNHFSLGKNVCVAGKIWLVKKKQLLFGLARTTVTAGGLLDAKPLLDGAMAFSEELCPLVSLHCFAF